MAETGPEGDRQLLVALCRKAADPDATPGQAQAWLAAYGIQLEHNLGVKNRLLFDRAKVEPLLKLKA